MQVTMTLDVDKGLIVVPAGFPGYEKYIEEHAQNSPEDLGPCLLLSLPALQLHLRTNDYYMGMFYDFDPTIGINCYEEMSLNIDTISGRINEHCYNASVFSTSNNFGTRHEKIVIDGAFLYHLIPS